MNNEMFNNDKLLETEAFQKAYKKSLILKWRRLCRNIKIEKSNQK